ncbi:glycoside hydrolase family 3 protein [Baudoinia panamericana UAMH 10762]|uniref:beta-glucosidase n=1 Tax=Baudoinia panamericana (strain UAMH 10762) TaxID=717646 RepID=M2NBN6_BAUPA|nr:glycoside hydrolase family 3 protein [Baudoinia panamericana UAMH 10762]EMC96559.1 glycoside hydrolase family 3 protein [Baudoinia panamericana UAMH 10762]
MRFIIQTVLLAAAGIALAQDFSKEGNFGAPFPDTTYPGFDSTNPSTIAGSRTNQTSPPKYPSPWGTGYGEWAAAYAKARAFVSQLTLEEKVNLTTGTGWELDRCVGQTGSIPRLAFRALCLQDSPVGVRDTDFNSVFPAGVNVAATWDTGVAFARGQAMGQEHRGKGVDMQLGPVAGPLGRVPEGGRNWEGFSPDPVLTGVMFAQSIQGIQSAGVMTSAKHYIAYEQEHFRLKADSAGYGFTISDGYSSNIDDVTMHELYLWPFADGVRAGATSVMCSYNNVNNSQACQNSYMMNYLLKGELGFQGFVVSDWLGTMSGVSSILAGLDMTMPGDSNAYDSGDSFFGANLTVAVLNGTVPMWRIDDMAMRIMAGFFFVETNTTRGPINFSSWTLDTDGPEHYYVGQGYTQINDHVNVVGNHGSLIRSIGARSTVLLKNVNNTLPLTGKEQLTAVFGNDAGPNVNGPNSCSDRGCDLGTLGMAWGSGSANFPYLVTPDTAIQNTVLSAGGAYESVLDNQQLASIGALARRASVSIIFANADSGEFYIQVDGNLGDRNNLTFWQGADTAISTVASNCSNTVLVVHSVGPVMLEQYKRHPNITAILWAGVPGQESGNSIADVLYGHINPGAKLPFTVGSNRSEYGTDVLYTPNNGALVPQLDFEEGVFIDYRAFDRRNITPTYEFGFGMSYTSFNYSNLRITKLNVSDYVPFSGYTPQAPVYGNMSLNASDHLFPANFSRVPLYQYPWLNTTDLARASADPQYGSWSFVPEGALDQSAQPIPPAGGAPGGNPMLYDALYRVQATITNTGSVAGEEVPQLYISRGGPYDPVRELRGFERLSIQPNTSATFSVDVLRRDIMSWDTVAQNWYVQNTTKTAWVGSSSRDLRLQGVLP